MDDYGRMNSGTPKPAETIFDLVDVVEEPEQLSTEDNVRQQLPQANVKVFELTDAIEENPLPGPVQQGVEEMIAKRVAETVEKIARELFPEIAERIIREEIEKLKNDDGIL